MDDRGEWAFLTGCYLVPDGRPADRIRERLSCFPNLDDYTGQIEGVLAIMGECRPWLTGPDAYRLTAEACGKNDAIAQQVDFYGVDVLPDQLRTFAGVTAGDIEAIAAYVMACAALALHALFPVLQDKQTDAVAHLDQHLLYLDAIHPVRDCVASTRLALDADAIAGCQRFADLSDAASRLAVFKADGYWGELARRLQTGSDVRDEAIRQKALELVRSGTRLHNLSSKLRAWQLRETGQALSKPAMNAILRRYNLHS
ncbi:hypothetical protein JHC42_15300 [Pseudomonas sp. OA3]|nr:hypothetical protein [Pseudomonas sp. OA3]